MADDRRPRPPAPPPGLAEERAAFTPAPAPAGHAGWDDSWTWETMPAALREELERRMEDGAAGRTVTFAEVRRRIATVRAEIEAQSADE